MKSVIAALLFFASVLAGASHRNPFGDQTLQYEPVYGIGDYLQYKDFLDSREIRLIFEIGSRDAIDAIRLGYTYQCPVFAFECHPHALKLCFQNVRNYPYVTVVPYACWNETKSLPFYPVVESHGGRYPVNIGASSLLVARKNGCDKEHVQGNPIAVQAVRLDEWMAQHRIASVDLVCMDCQGASLQVLQGMGSYLKTVKYLITEVYLKPSFEEEALFPEIKQMLEDQGFFLAQEPVGEDFCDVLFINRNLK